jgi:hypothetical protein
MYYLVIKNLGVERCIDKNRKDIYKNSESYNCHLDLGFRKKIFIREIKIRCIEFPDSEIIAKVYRN